MKILLIGISGVTCGGKTTLTSKLKKLFPKSKVISQDDYFLSEDNPHLTKCTNVDHVNYDIITSLDMEKMHKDILLEIGNNILYNTNKKSDINLHSTPTIENMCNILEEKNIQLIFIDGFLIFEYKPLLPLICLKYFFTLNYEECLERRKYRVYEPPDIPGYFEKCVWPEYLNHLKTIRNELEDVTYFDSSISNTIEIIIYDIYNIIRKFEN